MLSIQQVIDQLQDIAPLSLAEPWDNVGLLLGDPASPVQRIMTCLTVTNSVVEEAIAQSVNLIVSHHPVLFKPVQRIHTETEEGRLLWRLATKGIGIYSPHTAYDNSRGGINDQLAELLQLTEVNPLVPRSASPSFKVVVFVPASDLNRVSDALFEAGAGIIGNYERCSFRVQGTGTFCGNDKSKPILGQAGKFEEVPEYRLEVVCPAANLNAAIQAIHRSHSYEEPAFDIYPLHSVESSTSTVIGTGRLGMLAAPLSSQALADLVSTRLGQPVVLTGQSNRRDINRVAIVCGAGGSLLHEAIKCKADAFLTGEIRFHDELAAQSAGVTVIAAGHYATERPGVEKLTQLLSGALPGCKVWASCAEQNPARCIGFSPKASSD